MAVFPGGIKTYSAVSQKSAVPFDVFQSIQDEVTAIETYLGAGTSASSFTPTLVSSGGGTPTYSVQVGRYRQTVGEIRMFGRITLATFGTLAAGTISITGLPVAPLNVSNIFGAAIIPFWGSLTTPVVNVTGYIPPTSSAIILNIVTAAATSVTQMTKADLSATSDILFTGIYLTS